MLYTLRYHDHAAIRVRSAARFSFIIGDFSRHTHPEMWQRGVPCIERRFSLHTPRNLPFPPRCVTAGFLAVISRGGVFRDACCNPATLYSLL